MTTPIIPFGMRGGTYNARQLQTQLTLAMVDVANQREPGYLGMSGIGGCPREQYFRMVEPKLAEAQQSWYSMAGYVWEAGIKALLGDTEAACKTISNLEPFGVGLIADFDARYRGHIDHEIGNVLVEVKSAYWEKWLRIRGDGQPEYKHYAQVQSYLRHGRGRWDRAVIIYVARDIPHKLFYGVGGLPPFWCVDVNPNTKVQDELDIKAKWILRCVDLRDPPKCECGWCRT